MQRQRSAERTLKYEVGDWVAVRMAGAEGEYKPAKVVEADRDGVVVEMRFGRETRREACDVSKLRRIRWQRERGRPRWMFT